MMQEYEDQSSEEARFVKDLDRFDMICQASEYEQAESRPGEMQDFYDSTKGWFVFGDTKLCYATVKPV